MLQLVYLNLFWEEAMSAANHERSDTSLQWRIQPACLSFVWRMFCPKKTQRLMESFLFSCVDATIPTGEDIFMLKNAYLIVWAKRSYARKSKMPFIEAWLQQQLTDILMSFFLSAFSSSLYGVQRELLQGCMSYRLVLFFNILFPWTCNPTLKTVPAPLDRLHQIWI